MNDYLTLHTMIKDAPYEVRHLLIRSVDGPGVTVLTRLVSGVQSNIGTGKQYEMERRADAVIHVWGGEGFRDQREREPAWEDLKSVVTLAMLMGYRIIYDPPRFAVPLTQWPGRSGKNGGGYEYAFTGTMIVASPTLPQWSGLDMPRVLESQAVWYKKELRFEMR